MKPILGIELDDSSHKKPSREKRDEFVDKTFEAAGLPLVRIPVKQTYCQQEIATQLKQALSTKQA